MQKETLMKKDAKEKKDANKRKDGKAKRRIKTHPLHPHQLSKGL